MPKPTRATGGGGSKAGPAKSGGKPALPPADAAAPGGTGRGAARARRPASAAAAVPAKAKAAAGSPAKKPPLPPRATGTRAAAHPPPPAPEPPGPAAAASLFAQVVSAAHRAKRELAALGGEAVDLALGLAAPRPRRGAAVAGAATAPAPADVAAARSAGAATTSAPAVPPLPTWNVAAPPPRGAGALFPPPSPKGRRTPRGPGGGRSPARRGRKVGGRGGGKAGGGGGGAFARSPLRLSVQMGSAAAAAAAVAAATAAAAAVERRGHAIAPHEVGDRGAPPALPPVPSPSGRPVRAAAVAATAAVAANLAPTRVHMAAPAPEAGPGGPTAAAALRAARRDRSSTRHRRLFLPGLPGALTHGQPLTYRTPDGIVLLTGAAVVPPAGAPPTAAAGIHCAHCGEVVSAAAFEAHAGRAARRAPYDSTFTADGVSLRSLAAALPAPAAGEGVGHYPPGAPLEGSGGGGGGAAVPGGKAPATTATGTHPPLDLIPGGCVLCHRSDFQLAGFGPRTIIICDQCEREFHVDCLAASGRARLAGLPEGLWFCSPECHRISGSLRRVVAAGERPLPPGTHALHILRGRDGSRPTDAALRTATDLLAEAFDPILDAGTGLDLTTAMVSASQLGDWDYTGMFTALLKHKGAPVCAAVFRVFGPQVAELPLIATAAAARRRGHARVLVGALERLLAQLGVRGLCLPAAHETVGHWKDGFGFSVLEAGALRAARAELRLLVFPGTEVLSKKLGQARGPPLLVPPPPGRGSYGGGEAGRAPAEARHPTSPPPMIGGRSFATAGALAHLNGLTPAEAAEAAAAAAVRTRGGTGGGGGPGPGSRRPGAAVTAPRQPPPPPPRARATATAGAAAAGAGAAKRRAAADPAPARLAKAGKASAGKAAGGGGKASASARHPPSPPLRGRAATAAAVAPTPRLTRARSTH